MIINVRKKNIINITMKDRKIIRMLFSLMMISMTFPVLGNTLPDEPSPVERTSLNVFLECNCDMNYTREEIPYVNYVRDVREAQVYVRVTSQNTGSGGEEYTYSFQGLDKFLGMNDTLVFASNPDMTGTVVREQQTNLLKMGLVRYIARTPIINEINLVHNGDFTAPEIVDKWNNWVFEIRTSPRFNAEETYRSLNLFNRLSISKVTEDIKLDIGFFQSYNKQRFINDENNTKYIRRSESVNLLFVKSLGEHWSAGTSWNLRGSTQANYKLQHQFMPAIEYDLFPYSEATHRQLRILYSTGYEYSHYIDTSIFNQVREHRFRQDLGIAYQVQEKWGSINMSLRGSNYFHDFSKNSIEINGSVNIRIIKGLSFSLNGQAGYINDRLNQRKGTITEAERLLRLKQQATSFEVGGSISINYTFGSIYNNVVNPRFGNY
jgi:hypothetical protein